MGIAGPVEMIGVMGNVLSYARLMAVAFAGVMLALVADKLAWLEGHGILIEQWDLDLVECDMIWCGRAGSPTKVGKVESIVMQASERKDVAATREGIRDLVHELARLGDFSRDLLARQNRLCRRILCILVLPIRLNAAVIVPANDVFRIFQLITGMTEGPQPI